MKAKAYACVVVFLFTMFVAASCIAEEKEYFIPKRNEGLYGTWINEKYDSKTDYKWVLHNWGYCEAFDKIEDTIPTVRWTVTIVDKWTDDEGNLWYRTFDRSDYGGSGYNLYKISEGNTVLENTWRSTGFPTENDLDAKKGGYRILYRQ